MPHNSKPSPDHPEELAIISAREELLIEAERIAHIGSWIWDVAAARVSWSDELFRILGYDITPDGATIERWYAAIHPDDVVKMRADSEVVISAGSVPADHFRIVNQRDGSVRHVLANGAVLLDEHGQLERIVGTVLDVTEQREASLRLEQAHAFLQEAQSLGHLGTFVYDKRDATRIWSPELYRILGIDADEPPSRALFTRRVHPDDRPLITAFYAELDGGDGSLVSDQDWVMDVRLVRPDGNVRHARLRVHAERHAGELVGMRGIVQDVTDVTLLQKRLAHAEKMETIGRLAGGIAHDFNNIMTVIHGGAELLTTTDPSDLEILETMKSAVSSARDLTSRLVAFGRQSTLRMQPIDPNTIVHDTVRLVTRILGEHVTLTTDLAPDVPTAMLDASLTSQALINLLINARDAMPSGGHITVTTRRIDGPTSSGAEISVRDTGPGIAASLREKVFEPFFTTKNEGQGSGLGLAMVQGAVEQQGGTITFESSGAGTLFVMRFTAAPASAVPVSLTTPVSSLEARQGLRILLVEDHETLAYMVRRLLVRAGHEVWMATQPSIAVEIFRERAADLDLILTDVLMPEMTGIEMVAHLEHIAPVPRVVYMSGYSADAVRAMGNAPMVLAKPFTSAELLAAVERAVRD